MIKGGIKIVFTLLALCIVDRFGRKILLLVSYSGQLVCTLIVGSVSLAMAQYYDAKLPSESLSIVAITFIVVFVSFYQFGAGPIPVFLTSELIDTANRPKAQDSV